MPDISKEYLIKEFNLWAEKKDTNSPKYLHTLFFADNSSSAFFQSGFFFSAEKKKDNTYSIHKHNFVNSEALKKEFVSKNLSLGEALFFLRKEERHCLISPRYQTREDRTPVQKEKDPYYRYVIEQIGIGIKQLDKCLTARRP